MSEKYTPTVAVSTADQLQAALRDAKAADVIGLAAGVYEGKFELSAKGTEDAPVVVTGPRDAVIDGVTVSEIGDEAIHLPAFSSNNVVQNCVIHDTGLRKPDFGKSVYIGTASSNWEKISDGRPDSSDHNRIVANTIGPNVTAEHIDLKEVTSGGEVRRWPWHERREICRQLDRR